MINLNISDVSTVGMLRKKFKDEVGIEVRICGPDGTIEDDRTPLSQLISQSAQMQEVSIDERATAVAVMVLFQENFGIKIELLNPNGSLVDESMPLMGIRAAYKDSSQKRSPAQEQSTKHNQDDGGDDNRDESIDSASEGTDLDDIDAEDDDDEKPRRVWLFAVSPYEIDELSDDMPEDFMTDLDSTFYYYRKIIDHFIEAVNFRALTDAEWFLIQNKDDVDVATDECIVVRSNDVDSLVAYKDLIARDCEEGKIYLAALTCDGEYDHWDYNLPKASDYFKCEFGVYGPHPSFPLAYQYYCKGEWDGEEIDATDEDRDWHIDVKKWIHPDLYPTAIKVDPSSQKAMLGRKSNQSSKEIRDEIIKELKLALHNIIQIHLPHFKNSESFEITSRYGPGSYDLTHIDGSFESSLQNLVHHMMYELGHYARFLNPKQYERAVQAVEEEPDGIFCLNEDDQDEDNDNYCEVQYEIIDRIHVEIEEYVGRLLLLHGFDVGEIFFLPDNVGDMKKKFVDVPMEEDTELLFEVEAQLGEYDVLYQKWIWDGIGAESIIFMEEDIKGLSDDDLVNIISSSPLKKDEREPTVSRFRKGFAFVNFNFEVCD